MIVSFNTQPQVFCYSMQGKEMTLHTDTKLMSLHKYGQHSKRS